MFGLKKDTVIIEEKLEPFIYYSSRKIPIVKYRRKLIRKSVDESGRVYKISEKYIQG